MTKQTAKIDNWTLRRAVDGNMFLIGEVSEHPRQAEFETKVQSTSRVLEFNPAKNFAETENTIYTLGSPAKAK